ncbi:MAG: LysR substrate-binding domain-containing protein [Ottowia sp.]|uniref:LysR family transcriptional regulator n=1 Tax=Ottowia sp. TaxID=1898956 RepID=UPI003C724857
MELKQLRYFTKIADMGSLSAASRVLHISQPSLSYQISQLEEQIGKKLLLRQPTGVSMTIEGEAFYREALQILRQVDGIQGVVDSVRSQLTGYVSVAMAHTQAMQYALPLIQKVRDLHPRLQLEVFDGTSRDMLRAVGSGQRDLAVVIWDSESSILAAQPAVEEEIFLVSKTELAPQEKSILRSDVRRYPLILPSRDQIPESLYDLGLGIDESAKNPETTAQQYNIIVANSVGIFRQAILAGIAHSLQPWGALHDDIEQGRIIATPLQPPVLRKVAIGTARGAAPSQATRAVQKALLSVMESRVAEGFVKGRMLANEVHEVDKS